LRERLRAIPSGYSQAAAIGVTARTNPAGGAAGIEAATLRAAFSRSIDIALGVDVITPVVAFALEIVRVLLQMLLGFLLRDFLGLTVVPSRIRTMADLDLLVFVLVPVPVSVLVVVLVVFVPMAGDRRLRDPQESEHSRRRAAHGQP
jgi:hypothetical protein